MPDENFHYFSFTLPSASLLEEVAFGLKGEGKIQYVVITKVAAGGTCEEVSSGIKALALLFIPRPFHSIDVAPPSPCFA